MKKKKTSRSAVPLSAHKPKKVKRKAKPVPVEAKPCPVQTHFYLSGEKIEFLPGEREALIKEAQRIYKEYRGSN